ncbi:DUF3263 domain-containing protein [Gordonia effusa]|uniref:DUF3263 domain-containing protein n=1 Tax=Gordonia effusa TaxID=263908 RepID=UPI00031AF41A|nr:DUF3263 domain-containing protein [Gordonia effusa]
MTDYADELIDFARRWFPYGGGSNEDILIQFGISEHEYFRRLREALTMRRLDPAIASAIEAVAIRRLRQK